MGEVLAIVWRAIAGALIKRAGLTRATGQTGAVTLIQRFGSALNLNIHVVFAPLTFMARLAALVPKPRVHLTRYHGVFAPDSRWRAAITPAGRGERGDSGGHADAGRTAPRHDLGPAAEAGLQARPAELRRLWGPGAGDRLHRGPGW